MPRQGGVRSEGHVSVRCVYRPRMQALTTRSKSLAFQQSDIPGKNLQLTQRPQRHSSPRHTRRPTASPRSSPTPRPELLRPPRAASPSRLAAALRLELRLVAPPPHRARAPPFVAHQEHNEGTGNDRAREETQPVSITSETLTKIIKRQLRVLELLKSE